VICPDGDVVKGGQREMETFWADEMWPSTRATHPTRREHSRFCGQASIGIVDGVVPEYLAASGKSLAAFEHNQMAASQRRPQ